MRALALCLASVIWCTLLDGGQRPQPPIYRQEQRQNRRLDSNQPLPALRPQVDLAKVKREAEEIAKLAQSVPAQIEQAEHGAIPRDLGPRLKQIEKLSKKLRTELSL